MRLLLETETVTVSVSEMFVAAGVDTFQYVITNLMYKCICRLNESENELILVLSNVMFSTKCYQLQLWRHFYSQHLKCGSSDEISKEEMLLKPGTIHSVQTYYHNYRYTYSFHITISETEKWNFQMISAAFTTVIFSGWCGLLSFYLVA